MPSYGDKAVFTSITEDVFNATTLWIPGKIIVDEPEPGLLHVYIHESLIDE